MVIALGALDNASQGARYLDNLSDYHYDGFTDNGSCSDTMSNNNYKSGSVLKKGGLNFQKLLK